MRCLLAAWCALGLALAQANAIRGHVRSPDGQSVDGARLVLLTSLGSVVASAESDQGRFEFRDVPRGAWTLRVEADGFQAAERVLEAGANDLVITLPLPGVRTLITVTAARGTAQDSEAAPPVTSVVEPKPLPTIGHSLERTAGVFVQQSTTAQVSPFLRGLTGYQVLNLVDGVRFNNSTFRSGPNQYLALLEPTQAQRVETVLGPTGALYGSDALGGIIHVGTRESRFGGGPGMEWHGDLNLFGSSADLAGGGSAEVSVGNWRATGLAGVTGRRHNSLRAGGGVDSRHAFGRFFGLTGDQIRSLIGNRLPDTDFSQAGFHSKLAFRPSATQTLTVWYQRSAQHDVQGYKDLWGGQGRMQSRFTPQALDFGYVRYENFGLWGLDTLSATASFNRQRDGGIRQGLSAVGAVTEESSRVTALGYQVQGSKWFTPRTAASFGGDIYDETIAAGRTETQPVTGVTRTVRALYPAGARYATFGAFAQASHRVGNRLRAAGALRYSGVRYSATSVSRLWFRDLSCNASLSWRFTGWLDIHALSGRGFRAPNLNDLGSIGLNDLGYEIPAVEAGGALIGESAGEGARSTGKTVRALRPESLWNYEAGMTVRTPRLQARLQWFDSELRDPVVRRTLLYPADRVPTSLAGLPVVALPPTPAQAAQGVTAVASNLDPRAIKAFVNDGRTRYWGVESTLRVALPRRWSVEGAYVFLAGRDLDPNRPVRRLPPQTGSWALRYAPSGRRPWTAITTRFAGAQHRLSGGDLDDERIGASRRRVDIADFFRGSRVAPYLTADGRFAPTGETLRQIQDRVLPLGGAVVNDSSRVPWFLSTAGWMALDVAAGFPVTERLSLSASLSNLMDRNYRLHGSGVDAPGRNAMLELRFRF